MPWWLSHQKNWEFPSFFMSTLGIIQPHLKYFRERFSPPIWFSFHCRMENLSKSRTSQKQNWRKRWPKKEYSGKILFKFTKISSFRGGKKCHLLVLSIFWNQTTVYCNSYKLIYVTLFKGTVPWFKFGLWNGHKSRCSRWKFHLEPQKLSCYG